MTIDAFSLPQPFSTLLDRISDAAGRFGEFIAQGVADTFAPDIVDAQGHGVRFDIDASATVVSDVVNHEETVFGNTIYTTSYSATTTVTVSVDGGMATRAIPVTYQAVLPTDSATPGIMGELNLFDPASLPDGTRITLKGADYAGTEFEAAFRALTEINDLASLDQLQVVIFKTREGDLRVMSASEAYFEHPTVDGPSAPAAARADSIVHTTMMEPTDPGDAAAFCRLLVSGDLPDGTVSSREIVATGQINAVVTDLTSGEVNHATWTYDDQGRPMHAEATLEWEPSSRGRDSDTIEAAAQSGFRTDRGLDGTEYQTGHMFAYRFVNGHGSVNMFPQYGSFNMGAYASMESEWGDWLGAGMHVDIRIDLTPYDVARPDQVTVNYEVTDPETGNLVYDQQVTFENTDGQTFNRIAKADMAEMIANA